jgi:microcystin-dependent protein
MAQPYVGEIRMFAGTFAPAGWMFCSGQTLAISENETLFQLIGTTYGGDGESTFQLPDLQGRLPLHWGTGSPSTYQIGEKGGVEEVTLSTQQMPQHNHLLQATTTPGTQVNPGGSILSNSQGPQPFIQEGPDGNLNANSLQPDGQNQPHENRQPFLCISFIISLYGIYPSPT